MDNTIFAMTILKLPNKTEPAKRIKCDCDMDHESVLQNTYSLPFTSVLKMQYSLLFITPETNKIVTIKGPIKYER